MSSEGGFVECPCAQAKADGNYPPDCEIHVKCDDWCGALDEPLTLPEVKAAYGHWRHHGYLAGCSHAR